MEAINAGVGGYSAWQEYEYLRSRGVTLDPDMVVVGFVLNDVTENMDLVQFAGRWEGAQLLQSYYSL